MGRGSRAAPFDITNTLQQKQGGGGAIAVLVGGLGDDPDCDALRDVVGAQEAGADAEGPDIAAAPADLQQEGQPVAPVRVEMPKDGSRG